MQLYYIKNLVYWQLLVYGVHVGHSFKNSNIYAGWFSYTYRQQVVIINLFKTVLLFKNGYKSLDGTCRHRGSIWFINLHRALELFMNYAAKQCGEFCYSTYWIHGLISNWRVLSNTFRKLLKIEKNAYKGKFRKLELNSTPITFTRFSWPRVSLITSVWSSPFPTKECLYAKVCCIGIVDTNIPGHIANNPIPGNDDSIDSIVFYNTHIAQYILEKKYGFIISWLNKIRVIPRINAFGNWVLKECISNEGGISRQKINSLHFNEDNATSEISKFLIKKRLYLSSFWDEGLKFFFATNSNILTIQEQVDVYEQDETPLDLMEIMFKQRDFAVFHIKTCNLQLFKKRWSKLKQLRKKLRFTNKTIKYKLLNRFYIKKRESWRLQLQDYKRNFWLYKLKKNRLFRTFFRRPKFFRTKGMPRILKYFVLKFYEKYNGCGLFSRYQINLLNISHLSYLLLTYYSKFMKEKIYDNLSKSAPSFWKQLKYRKVGAPTTLTYWKKNVREKILAIVGNNKLNMTIKFNMYYKSFKKIVQFIQRLKSKLYFGFMCYFMMRFWIKREASLSKSKLREYKKAKFLLLRNLFKKNNNKLKILFDIKSMINNKKLLLRKTNVNILLKNNIILRYFKLLTLNYLNNLQKMSRHGIIKKNWSDNRIVSLNSKNKLPKCEISDIKKFFKKFSKKQRSLKLNKKKMIKYSFNVRKLWSRLRSLYNFYKKKLQSNIWVERKKRRKLRRKIKKLNRLKKKTKYQRRLKRRLRRLLRIRVYQRRRYYKPSVLRRHKFPIDIKINRTYIIENLIWIYKILKKYKLLIYSSNNVRKLNIINKYKNKQFNLYKKKINNYKKKKNSILLKNDKYWIKLKKK